MYIIIIYNEDNEDNEDHGDNEDNEDNEIKSIFQNKSCILGLKISN